MAGGEREKTDAEVNLERFLAVEFLHSLGSYRGAMEKGKQFDRGSIPDAGGALNRTRALNALLHYQRDDSREEVRHPDPAGDEPQYVEEEGEGGEGGGPAKAYELGLLLDEPDSSRKRLRRITDFYSTGIAALNGSLGSRNGQSKSTPEPLECLAACLFWDREPASSVWGVNKKFREHYEAEDGGEKPQASSVRSRIEAKRDRFLERRTAVEAAPGMGGDAGQRARPGAFGDQPRPGVPASGGLRDPRLRAAVSRRRAPAASLRRALPVAAVQRSDVDELGRG
jgi:hypothetical protein